MGPADPKQASTTDPNTGYVITGIGFNFPGLKYTTVPNVTIAGGSNPNSTAKVSSDPSLVTKTNAYQLKTIGEPLRVRLVAVPPTVTPAPPIAASVPSATVSVTVRSGESISLIARGLAGQVRLLATSSVTLNFAGAQTFGASFTAENTIELMVVDVCWNEPYDSLRAIESGLKDVLLAAGV